MISFCNSYIICYIIIFLFFNAMDVKKCITSYIISKQKRLVRYLIHWHCFGLHKTDLVHYKSCQKTAEPPFSPDCNQPSRVQPQRVIELGSGLFQASTRRAFLSFLLDTILDMRGNFMSEIESEIYL